MFCIYFTLCKVAWGFWMLWTIFRSFLDKKRKLWKVLFFNFWLAQNSFYAFLNVSDHFQAISGKNLGWSGLLQVGRGLFQVVGGGLFRLRLGQHFLLHFSMSQTISKPFLDKFFFGWWVGVGAVQVWTDSHECYWFSSH